MSEANMAEAKAKPEPIRQSVLVDCPIEDAFRLFTEEFAEWWPLASHSITGDDAETCAIEPWIGGRVFESTRSGEEREWGIVTVWEPPRRVEFTWHMNSDESQLIDIEFRVQGDGTQVTLTHRGWDVASIQASLQACAHCFSAFVSRQMVMMA